MGLTSGGLGAKQSPRTRGFSGWGDIELGPSLPTPVSGDSEVLERMHVKQAPLGECQVIDEVFIGMLLQTRQSRVEVGGIGVHHLGDLPVGWGLMTAHANIAKTPAPRHVRCHVRADAAVELEQEVVNGKISKPPVGNGQLGFGDAFRQQRRELLIAQDVSI